VVFCPPVAPFVFFAPLPLKIAPLGAIPPTLRTTELNTPSQKTNTVSSIYCSKKLAKYGPRAATLFVLRTAHNPFCLVLTLRTARASERNFTRRYEDRYRAPLAPSAAVKTCIACLDNNQNTDKAVTLLRFTNRLIALLQLPCTSNFGLDYRKT